MIEADAPSTWCVRVQSVPAPPGVVILAPPTMQRNAQRNASGAQSEGRAKESPKKRGQGQYKGRSLKAPAR
jgi:hypothetical protein